MIAQVCPLPADIIFKPHLMESDMATVAGEIAITTTDSACWHALIGRAEAAECRLLNTDAGRYLVNLLVCYNFRGQAVESLLASLQDTAVGLEQLATDTLRELGDHCLLLAGLLPETVTRQGLMLTEMVYTGRQAYAVLAARGADPVYAILLKEFVHLMDLLQTMRELDGRSLQLDPLQLHALWVETGSRKARRLLPTCSDALPLAAHSLTLH